MKYFTLLALLAAPLALWATSPTEESITGSTNYVAVVVANTGTASTVVCTNRAFRVSVVIVNQSGDNLCVNLGTTCGTNTMLSGTNSRYEILPPLKYYGEISVRNTTSSTAGRVLVYETWRDTP